MQLCIVSSNKALIFNYGPENFKFFLYIYIFHSYLCGVNINMEGKGTTFC